MPHRQRYRGMRAGDDTQRHDAVAVVRDLELDQRARPAETQPTRTGVAVGLGVVAGVGVEEAVEDDVGEDRTGLAAGERLAGRASRVGGNVGALVDVGSSAASLAEGPDQASGPASPSTPGPLACAQVRLDLLEGDRDPLEHLEVGRRPIGTAPVVLPPVVASPAVVRVRELDVGTVDVGPLGGAFHGEWRAVGAVKYRGGGDDDRGAAAATSGARARRDAHPGG